MSSHSITESQEPSFLGCFSSTMLNFPVFARPTGKPINTVSASRSDFAAATAASLFPNTQFTNHESLPSLDDALSCFTTAYPLYSQTHEVDQIRAQHYFHFSLYKHICFDYFGFGLFSYSQQRIPDSISSSARPPLSPNSFQFPFFDIAYKPTTLHSQILNRGEESELESRTKKRIMDFLNFSETEYHIVFMANAESAFKLLGESYPFQSNHSLLSVYDYNSEAIQAMIERSHKRGTQVMSAQFSWPSLKIQSEKLTKLIVSKKKRKRGLFVFPLQSRISGRRYSYQWMKLAQENGWHVLLDGSALGPKDMNSFGLSLFKPDFLICSFFKVFGENPSGFGCLFIKKSSAPVLETSTTTRSSLGIVTLVPANKLSQSSGDDSDALSETLKRAKHKELEQQTSSSNQKKQYMEQFSPEIEELDKPIDLLKAGTAESIATGTGRKKFKTDFECLDHADSLGLTIITCRTRYLTNWLVNALMKLRHPHSEQGLPLVRIYGPKIKFNRGAAVAFNVFDWKGEKVEPRLVQKLADRNNISISCGFLQNIWFSDKYEEEKVNVLEPRNLEATEETGKRSKARGDMGIRVVTAAVGFLINFEDIYRLWAFVAQFLDADFVEKERWRYTALNQKTIEV